MDSDILPGDALLLELVKIEVTQASRKLERALAAPYDKENKEALMKYTNAVEAAEDDYKELVAEYRLQIQSAKEAKVKHDNSVKKGKEPGTSYTPPNPTVATATYKNNIKFPLPPNYNGDMALYTTWAFKTEQYVTVMEHQLDTDARKIAFVGSLLTDNAAVWYQTYVTLKKQQEAIAPVIPSAGSHWKQFLVDLEKRFKDPQEALKAGQWLDRAYQSAKSFDDWAVEFETYVTKTGQSPDAFCHRFIGSLNIVTRENWHPVNNIIPTTFDALVRDIRNSINTYNVTRGVKTTTKIPVGSSSSTSTSRASFQPKTPSPGRSTPTGAGRVWVDTTRPGPYAKQPGTDLAKHRIANGLCLSCGMKGHMARGCPTYPSTNSGPANYETGKALMQTYKEAGKLYSGFAAIDSVAVINTEERSMAGDNINTDKLESYPTLAATGRLPQASFIMPFQILTKEGRTIYGSRALIDSGASRCYIAKPFVKTHHIPTTQKRTPVVVALADGSKQHRLVETIEPVTLILGKHGWTAVTM